MRNLELELPEGGLHRNTRLAPHEYADLKKLVSRGTHLLLEEREKKIRLLQAAGLVPQDFNFSAFHEQMGANPTKVDENEQVLNGEGGLAKAA